MAYFTVNVKPTITASLQHASAFATGDLLFDWTEVNIGSRGALLRSVTAMVRAKGDATPTRNAFAFHLLFSSSNATSLGTLNAAPDHVPNDSFIGSMEFEAANFVPNTLQSTTVATSGKASNSGKDVTPMVLTPSTGQNLATPGKIYVAAIAGGAFDFISLNANTEDLAAGHANSQVITMDGTGMDVREHFIDGDIIHIGTSVGTPPADSLIGTVASADSATQITLDDVSATELVDGDIFYNIHPIQLVLSFEK